MPRVSEASVFLLVIRMPLLLLLLLILLFKPLSNSTRQTLVYSDSWPALPRARYFSSSFKIPSFSRTN